MRSHRILSVVLLCVCASATLAACGRRSAPLATAAADAGNVEDPSGEGATWDPSSGPFEGTLRVQFNQAHRDAVSVKVDVKKRRARWDVDAFGPDVSGYRVYDADARLLYTVTPALKRITSAELPRAGAEGAAPWKLASAGSGVVSGVPCERERTDDEQNSYEVCVARGILPVPLAYASSLALTASPFLDDLLREGVFPLAAVARLKAGGAAAPKEAAYRVMAFLPHPVDDARFELPDFPVSQGGLARPIPQPSRR
jgi:hypothetical protein